MSHLEQFNQQHLSIREKIMQQKLLEASEDELNKQTMFSNNLAAVGRAFSLQRGAISGPAGPINHSKNISNLSHNSMLSSLNNNGENIYDSKLNEERPMIHKSLGKQQIFNQNATQHIGMEVENMTLSPQPISDEMHIDQNLMDPNKNMNHQIISSKPQMRILRTNNQNSAGLARAIHLSNAHEGSASQNHATLNQSQMTIGSVSTVFKEFQPSMPFVGNIGRQKNLVNLLNAESQQPGISSGLSQYESMNDDGISFNSNIMQSMSSIAAG